MSVNKTLSRFKTLVTKTVIPREFTDMIRGDSTLFWSNPIGSSVDFHRAFHSRKTNPAVRYAMALSGILGEENVVNRSLSGLRSNLHFKVEPQYRKSKGRLRLSHFEIKGYSPSGYGKILAVGAKQRKMIMGTPTDPFIIRFGVAAMDKKRDKSKASHADRIRAGRHAKALARFHDKTLPGRKKRERRPKLTPAEKSKLKFQKAIADHLVPKPKPPRKKISRPKVPVKRALTEIDADKQPPEGILDILMEMKAERGLDPIDWNAGKPKKERRKSPTRKLTNSEKRKILRALVEIVKHLQGILWILHYTIKLNDKRRKFHYIDKNHKWVATAPHEVLLNLFGFPEHLLHYIRQHHAFRDWFKFMHMEEHSNALLNEMATVFAHALRIDDKMYPNEEAMQDVLDILLDDCSRLMKHVTDFYESVSNLDWIFQIRVVSRAFKLPDTVPRHKRHTKKNRVFTPEKDPQDVKSKIGYYKYYHGEYWKKAGL